jgi:molybdenum-dependent DNA-binding transcriptional regulator ModE
MANRSHLKGTTRAVGQVVGRPEPQSGTVTADEIIEALTIWPGVGLRHLAAFVAIAEERSFRGAAKRLRYAQPTVSHQMAALERAVGGELIERGSAPFSARPTPAGESLLQTVHEVAELIAAARRELADLCADGRSRHPHVQPTARVSQRSRRRAGGPALLRPAISTTGGRRSGRD